MRIVLISLLFLVSCTTPKNLPNGAVEVKLMNSMDEFVTEFLSAVIAKDQIMVMVMMHPSYVKEQHDEFLEGRTKQFLSEFFGAEFNNIKDFEHLYSYTRGADIYAVFEVRSNHNDKSIHHYHIKFRNDSSGFKFGMVGAVG
jgi:hypothetical protein